VAIITLVIVALIVLWLAAGGPGSLPSSTPPSSAEGQTPAGRSQDDAVFAGLDRTDVSALMRRGRELYDQNRFEDASRVYQEVLKLAPDNQAAHSNLGSTYFRMQLLDLALKEFREAVRLNPNDAEARQNLGAGLAALGDLDSAIAEYLQAIAMKPDLAPAHYSLGVLYQEKGNKDKAIEELTRFLELGGEAEWRPDAERRLKDLGVK